MATEYKANFEQAGEIMFPLFRSDNFVRDIIQICSSPLHAERCTCARAIPRMHVAKPMQMRHNRDSDKGGKLRVVDGQRLLRYKISYSAEDSIEVKLLHPITIIFSSGPHLGKSSAVGGLWKVVKGLSPSIQALSRIIIGGRLGTQVRNEEDTTHKLTG